jgi:metal-responsive CopG/Arc/MetJ family transcriptional regulator
LRRTQLYLTKEQAESLDRLARQRGVRRSALVRAAVDRLLAEEKGKDDWKAAWASACGIWENRPEVVDEIAAVRRRLDLRNPWRR